MDNIQYCSYTISLIKQLVFSIQIVLPSFHNITEIEQSPWKNYLFMLYNLSDPFVYNLVANPSGEIDLNDFWGIYMDYVPASFFITGNFLDTR